MRQAHTVQQVRAAEVALLATLPPGTLMQRAATGLADACVDFIGGAYGKRVLLVVGGGDNGGDALFAGALLARRGARVDVLLVGDRAHPAGLAALLTAGGRVTGSVSPADLAVDAIVGIGGRPGLSDQAYAVIRDLRQRQIPVLAVDVPSGVDVDGATLPARHVTADVTITFGTHKLALLAGPAAEAAGVVHLVDIGLGDLLGPAVATTTSAADLRRHAALLVPGPHDHKYTRGVVGVAAGSADYTGAGLLCVAGASCGLAGMVRYCGDDEVVRLVRAAHPEVVIGQGRVQAWVVGSGGGGGADDALRRALADEVPVVIDADALQHVGGPLPVPVLLTPHAGELARMLDVERGAVEADPVAHVRQAADRFAATVLLKGSRTLVAGPPGPAGVGELLVNTTSTPWLGTAGAGDVLAGLCGALAATVGAPGGDLTVVGGMAAWVHGAAGVAASAGGPITAGDVARALPQVVRAVLVTAGDAVAPPT